LTEHLSKFIDLQVEGGRHQNASEVVREALRRYEEDVRVEQANLAVIEKVAQEGIAAIERGEYISISSPEDRRALLERWTNGLPVATPSGKFRRG
jgi:antitoxin ParD1/3/4